MLAVSFSARSQLIVGNADPYILVTNVLAGKGIKTDSIIYVGDKLACGFFENGLSTKLKMDKGVILSSGMATGAKGPNNNIKFTAPINGFGTGGSSLLNDFGGAKTVDAAILEFDFVPQTENIVFHYIFASEEYPEYVDSVYNDIFGFFISGPGITGEQNVASVPGKSISVSINNINSKRNSTYFSTNLPGEKTIQADGFTSILTANLTLQPCKKYRIKLAIADVVDRVFDSWVFIEAGSFQHKTNLGRDTFICKDNFDVELDAGNPGRRVEWRKDGILLDTTQKIKVKTFGIYEVEVFTDCGSFIARKKILPGVGDISLGNDTLYCGDSLSRVLEVKNRVFDSYLWSDGSTDETLIAKKPGLYWLEISNDGCKKRDSVTISLEPKPKVELGKDTIVCGKVDLILSVKEVALKYRWHPNDETDIRIRVDKPGTYSAVSYSQNCSDSDAITISQRKELSVDLGIPLREICENDTISLRTGIKDTASYPTIWNTGDKIPTIYVSHSGTYSVIVRDKLCNFIATDSTIVKVYEGEGNVWVPNAFTPGQDELNNVFKPVSDIESYGYYKFLVFDRWGQKLFETDDPKAFWDGNYQNKPCENDVYIWSLNVKTNCSKGDKNFQRGIVHLIR